ncbi:MFS transporter [Moorella sulfitireducens]|uniref:MFS transporter n=1 Tax=Neomoorella sulfitireducens TaxID=2972948 RepID=UPI0021AD4C0A|nr:MFS transporter [Moorella sulfitireducens]
MNPFQANPPGKKIMSVIAVYLAIVTSILVSSGASTLLPVAAKEIGGIEFYSLAMTLSGVVSIILMALYGYFAAANPAGRRILFTVSLLVAAACIFLRGIAPNMWVIVLPSTLLAMYSPSIYILGYSLIRDMYDQKQAGIYLGIVGTMQSLGMLIGPTLTGMIIQIAGWRVVNFIISPLFALSGLLMFFGCKVSKEEAKSMARSIGKFDYPGAFSVAVFLGALVLALSLGKIAPFGSIQNNALLALSFIALLVLIFVVKEKRADAFIPSTVLTDRNTVCLAAANFFGNLSTMALFFFLPLYILYVMKQSPLSAGAAISFYSIAGLFMGPILGRMIAVAGNGRTVLVWFSGVLRVIVTVAIIFLLKPTTPLITVYILTFLAGFYSTAGGVAPAVAPQIQIRPEIRQQGNSVVQLAQNLGSAIGISIYTAVITAFGPMNGMPIGLWIAAGAAVAVIIFALPLKKLESVPQAQSNQAAQQA